jgi:hypothetical protein
LLNIVGEVEVVITTLSFGILVFTLTFAHEEGTGTDGNSNGDDNNDENGLGTTGLTGDAVSGSSGSGLPVS